MFNTIRQEFQYGNQQVVLETGRIARQANSVLVHMGGVSVLVAVVVRREAVLWPKFLPVDRQLSRKNVRIGQNSRWLWQA